VETRVDQMEKILKDREMELLFARVASNLLSKGNVNEAIRICEHGLKRFPMYAQGHYVMAMCYDQEGKHEEARIEYERVMKYDPNHLRALKRLTQIYQSNGMEDLYKEKSVTLARLNPFDPEVQQNAKDLVEKKLSVQSPEEQVSKEIKSEKHKDPLDVPKVDLSQFDNQDDDFTTIIQGKSADEEVQSGEKDDINLAVGTASAELQTDTETNNRMEYETEQRLSEESGNSDEDENFEDLDELKFEDDKGGKKEEAAVHEEWAMAVGENDATEIVIKKKGSETDFKSAKKKNGGITASEEEKYQQPKIVTQTLGEILVSQKKYVQALKVFETLQELHPENKNILKKVEFLKKIISLEQK
jgi:hypothetical protein